MLNQSLAGATASNPAMNYDSGAGLPSAANPPPNGYQLIVPPFTNLAAIITERNGAGPIFTWNQIAGAWVQI